MDHTITRLDGEICPLPASVRRMARPGKNCAWRQAGRQIQGRWLRGKDTGCGWQQHGQQGAEVRGQQGQPREQERARGS